MWVGEGAGSRQKDEGEKMQLLFTLVLDLPLVFHSGGIHSEATCEAIEGHVL